MKARKRSTWYCLSTPPATATTAAVMPPPASRVSHRRRAPETASTPNTVAVRTSIVPRSGWARINVAGTAAMTSIPTTSTMPTRARHRPSARSATTSAIPITTASLANSEGWIDRPATISQDRDPLMVDPITSTSTSPSTEARYTTGARIRTHRWSVAVTTSSSTPPIATLTSCLRRYAEESPPVRSSRAEVADQTSRVPRVTRAITASSSTQSSPGVRPAGRLPGRLVVGRLVGRGAGRVRDIGPQSSGVGGRMEPSSVKVGSRVGSVVPGIAARRGRTSSPSMP